MILILGSMCGEGGEGGLSPSNAGCIFVWVSCVCVGVCYVQKKTYIR